MILTLRSSLTSITVMTLLFVGCNEEPLETEQRPKEVVQFLNAVEANPILIDGVKIGDSWRLIREQAAFNDGEFRKEFDDDLIKDPSIGNYKEFWVFNQDELMRVFEGNRFDKNWDNYYEVFAQSIDIEKKMLSIEYVYDDGDKKYTRNFHVTTLTQTELILTEESTEEEYFYQYTFRREKL